MMWMDHMCHVHVDLDTKSYFIQEGEEIPSFVVKTEVSTLGE